MGTIPTKMSEGNRPTHVSSESSMCSQDDDAVGRLMTKDPVLGQVLKIIMEKLDETSKDLNEMNRKLDDFHDELRRDLDACHDRSDNLDVRVELIEKDKAKTLEPNAKQLDKTRRQIVQDCLGLPTILRRILENFSDQELIDLSLVNKLWNFEARSVLRDRGGLKAMICAEPTGQSLVYFASDLKPMRVVPFTGIHVDTDRCESIIDTYVNAPISQAFEIGSLLDPAYQVILDRLQWKHLSVAVPFNWRLAQDYPAFVLVKKILENYCGVLQDLSISNLDSGNIELIQAIIQGLSFPCLKTLKVNNFVHAAFAKALMSCAPNLEKFIITDDRINMMENFMTGSTAVLVAASGFDIQHDKVCESLIGALRTETIAVHHFTGFEVESLNRIVPMILEASSTTLHTLHIDLLFAIPLMCYGICMENVTELFVWMSDTTMESMQPHILGLFKCFDFTRIFPKLNQVEIMYSEKRGFSLDDIGAFVQQGNVVARKALPDRAINIRHLEIHYSENFMPLLDFLAQIFPHVKKLSVTIRTLQEFPFTLLWEHFGFLAELHIEFNESSSYLATNLDSVFCGIFPEEVAELRAKDDEYLKAVNIVPVMPSITCMRVLRSLTCQDHSRHRDDTCRVPTRIFSKVTRLIAFPRCPALSIEFPASPTPQKGCTIL